MRLLVLLVAVLAALSLPGVRTARAEGDLVPPARELFSWRSARGPSRSGPASCAPSSEHAARLAAARREAALARIAELARAGPAGGSQPLDFRGYGYRVGPDLFHELRKVEMEALRQRQQRAAGER